MKATELKNLKHGTYFKRKPEAKTEYIREHYNRADSMGPASICCADSEDVGRCIQLKPTTIVYIDGETL